LRIDLSLVLREFGAIALDLCSELFESTANLGR
jgi:hypothetical protein